MREERGRLALAMTAAVAMAAGALVVTGVAAVAGTDCAGTRDVLVTSLATAEGTQRDGLTRLTLTVVSRGCALPGSVGYALKPVTTDDKDLTYRGGTLTFAEGDLKDQALTVDVRADDVVEPDEQFAVVLTELRGATRACDTMAVVTVVNDDPGKYIPPTITPSILPCELHSSR
ncbi:Calx-beta domain-containing protein [Hamadaea tsunoensis]|uniref:Calx-beta domain-containing protein n=1 Tax=Hamadaea tsunoensis TaxID=53368 RepID=UPI00042A191C|nr:hypothetical protein [Hamadaea tsunoensis]